MGGHLDLTVRVQDFRVTGAKVSVGGLHRGIEGLCEGRTFSRALPVVARAAVRSSVHWQVAYAEAVESLCGLEVPARAVAIRVALMELERIADHMLAHATTLDLLGCRAAAARVWADRELVMDTSQAVTGQRLVQDAVVIGGVAWDADSAWPQRVTTLAKTVQAAIHQYVREGEVLHPLDRLEGLVPVHKEDVMGWGLTGPVLRATGIKRDARADERSRAYRDVDVPIVVKDTNDAIARTEVRLLEMTASAKVLSDLVRGLPGGRVRTNPPEVFPKGTAIGVVEDPRGEVLCFVSSDGTDRPRRVRFRSPDMAHAAALSELLIDCPEDDVALAVASIDLHVGGIDR
jgi:NADH-quinone oxidoreductase subunit D